ncbi:hypothetical protein ACFOUV_15590 [Oceanobacillus longus]|uniref:Uncharacterized protein n=1 Tax=Oceanobacillus longus TaxID=930120 RepID=A0ABV8GZC5_9BACI
MGFLDQFTGKDTQAVVDEYSEVYGEILLGMNRKLKTLERKIKNIQAEKYSSRLIDNTKSEIDTIRNSDLHKHIDPRSDAFSEEIRLKHEQYKKEINHVKLNITDFEESIENKLKKTNELIQQNKTELKQIINQTEDEWDHTFSLYTEKAEMQANKLTSILGELNSIIEQKAQELLAKIHKNYAANCKEMKEIKTNLEVFEEKTNIRFEEIEKLIQQDMIELENRMDVTQQEINENINNTSLEIFGKVNTMQSEFNERFTTMESSMKENILSLKKRQTYTWIVTGIVIIILIAWNIWLTT